VTRLLLLRHAQSTWNANGRWQGHADPPLSELGRRQAVAASARLGPVDVVLSSPLERARTTAAILADTAGVGPVAVEPELIERDVGEWTGLTRADIEARWPGWLDRSRRPPGFETDESLVRRALAALTRLATQFADAHVLVVTHGGVISAIERHHGEPRSPVPNLSGRTCSHHLEGFVLGERIALLDGDDLAVPAPR
jgi:probable phosphoglycerate mutase